MDGPSPIVAIQNLDTDNIQECIPGHGVRSKSCRSSPKSKRLSVVATKRSLRDPKTSDRYVSCTLNRKGALMKKNVASKRSDHISLTETRGGLEINFWRL